MQWGLILLSLAGLFSAIVSLYLHKKTDRLKFLGLFLASLLFVAVTISTILRPVFPGGWEQFIVAQISEWGHIYVLALIFSSLLLFVRESKPEFSRFPIAYVAFPVCIVISYLLVYDTIILKNWLLSIYHGGAVLVTLLIYGIYAYRESIYLTVFIGAIGFLISFAAFILLPLFQIIWQILLTISISITFAGYLMIDRHFTDNTE